jgi:uncharacterized protein
MAVYFIDTSALVKRYVRSEIGSAWVLGLLDPTLMLDPTLNNEVYIAALTGVEIIAAITRRARGRSISAVDAAKGCSQFRNDLQTQYQVIEITENIIVSGMTLAETYGLRGYDAIQLAVGCAVNTLCIASSLPPTVFVSADNELNIAASSESLIVENPNKHP